MTVNELSDRLREMYETPGANKTTMIHLFGIIYADEISKARLKPVDIIRGAQMQESYVTEINKGLRLSRYVELKATYADQF